MFFFCFVLAVSQHYQWGWHMHCSILGWFVWICMVISFSYCGAFFTISFLFLKPYPFCLIINRPSACLAYQVCFICFAPARHLCTLCPQWHAYTLPSMLITVILTVCVDLSDSSNPSSAGQSPSPVVRQVSPRVRLSLVQRDTSLSSTSCSGHPCGHSGQLLLPPTPFSPLIPLINYSIQIFQIWSLPMNELYNVFQMHS